MKKNFKLFQRIGLIIAISALFFISPVKSDTTYVSGSIVSSNWTVAGSPYVVTADISITSLIIDPGVSVLFAGNYEFVVAGVIEAIGTEQAKIIFTTRAGTASWKGIRFQNSSPGCFMKWCIVEKGNNSGIQIVESLPNLFNCIIRNNSAVSYGGGIRISNSTQGNLTFTNCTIENNLVTNTSAAGEAAGGGVIVFSGGVTFINCNILRNRAFSQISASSGIAVAFGGGVALINNDQIFKNCKITMNTVTAINTLNGMGTTEQAFARGGGLYTRAGVTTIRNSIIAKDSLYASAHNVITREGGGMYFQGSGQTFIENSTIVNNKYHGLYRNSSTVSVINSIIYFNDTEISGNPTVTYSDIDSLYPGEGNIDVNPNLNSCLQVTGGPCVDAGKDSIIYRDACIPPSLGNLRNDMGAHGGPGACNWLYVQEPPCSPWPVSSINIELTALMQGLYNPVTNMMARPQSEILYLRNATCPYAIVEPAASTLNQNGISSTEFIFNSAPSGTYYLVTKNWNCLETWSKVGGEVLYNDGETNFYDFTTAPSQAYGNNLIQIDDSPLRYGIYIGDVSQFGAIDLADVLAVYQDASAFRTGYVVTDLNGDYQVNLTDVLIAYNNSVAFVAKKPPLCPP